jgi:serine/threonine protein kinase/predicted Zn-dependent protease
MKCPKCHFDNASDSKFCKECGTQIQCPKEIAFSQTETLQTPIQELTTGSTFAGRYQIIEELGKGGMGKVYKVFDKEIQAKMALKLIKPEVSADRSTIERFRNELKIARDISHKNICRMYDLGKEAGNYFITMEYVSGEDLKSFIRRAKQLVVGTAIFIAKQVCDGLAEAHRLGVVHRDLKPGNIMIDREGNAKIMDFGIARSISVKGITGAGVMIGTPEYMSPEQVEGKEVDQRSDIYSLGIIIYEMVTGRVPFEGDTPFTIGVKHKSEIPRDPRELNAQIPQDLSCLILKCLEKDKEKRYQSADELRADLEKIEKGVPTTERPVPKRKTATAKPITLTISRKKFFVPLSILVAIVIIGIGLWRFLPKHHVAPLPPSGKPSLAILYFENISGDKSLDPWKTALTELLITKLSQSKYINVLSSDRIFSLLKRLNLQEARKYSTEDLVKVADEGGATYTLSGSLMRAGKNIIMTLALQKPRTGEIISPLNIECSGEEEIFPKIDELARTIKSDLNLSPDQIVNDIDKPAAKITTDSPEAYKYYSEAEKYLARGDLRKAIQLYERAVELDPEFASAYLSMAIAYFNLGLFSEANKFFQRAFELKDRISDRERYQAEAEFYSSSEKTYDKAIEAFNKLLDLYPDDNLGNADLGFLYAIIEEWDKAIERYEVCIKNRDDSLGTYGTLAGVYLAKGQYDKATEVFEYYLKNFPENARIHELLARNYLCLGKYELALREVDRSFFLDSTYYRTYLAKGAIYYCQGDMAKAEKEIQTYLEKEEKTFQTFGLGYLGDIYLSQGKFEKSKEQFKHVVEQAGILGKEWESGSYISLAYVLLRSGNPEKALKEYEEAWRIAVGCESLPLQRSALYFKGAAYIEMGAIDEAQRTADELRELIQQGMDKKQMRLYYLLLGNIELKRKNHAQAIKHFSDALALVSHGNLYGGDIALFIDSLALAYYQSGDLEKALGEYERIISLTTARMAYGDIYAKAYYMLGKIAEQQGENARARVQYQRFLGLWKDADPGQPEVEDAKNRVEKLKG